MTDLRRVRQLSRDARERLDSLFVESPREEILRPIGELQAPGRLSGDQGLVLEAVEQLLREGDR